jgi:hypothetical protein
LSGCEEEDRKYIEKYIEENLTQDSSRSYSREFVERAINECSCYLERVRKLIKNWKIERLVFVDLEGLKTKDAQLRKIDRVFIISRYGNKLLLGVECKKRTIPIYKELKEVSEKIRKILKKTAIQTARQVKDFYLSRLLQMPYEKIALVYIMLRQIDKRSIHVDSIINIIEDLYSELISQISEQEVVNNLILISDLDDTPRGIWKNIRKISCKG